MAIERYIKIIKKANFNIWVCTIQDVVKFLTIQYQDHTWYIFSDFYIKYYRYNEDTQEFSFDEYSADSVRDIKKFIFKKILNG